MKSIYFQFQHTLHKVDPVHFGLFASSPNSAQASFRLFDNFDNSVKSPRVFAMAPSN